MTLAGIGIGLISAVAAAQFLGSLLFGGELGWSYVGGSGGGAGSGCDGGDFVPGATGFAGESVRGFAGGVS